MTADREVGATYLRIGSKVQSAWLNSLGAVLPQQRRHIGFSVFDGK